MQAADIADAILYIVTRPWHMAINEILIRPTEQERIDALNALDERAGPEAATAAHRHEPDLLVGALELVQQRRDQPRAGRPERVASAIAPPLTLTRSMSGSSSRRQAAITARTPR